MSPYPAMSINQYRRLIGDELAPATSEEARDDVAFFATLSLYGFVAGLATGFIVGRCRHRGSRRGSHV